MTALCAIVITASAILGQPDAKQSALPDNIVKELNYYVGEWTVEGNLAGKPLKGRWSSRWANQKQCLLVTSSLNLDGEQVHANGVSGWDAGRQEIVTMAFFSNGVLEDIRYKVASPGVLKGVYTVSAEGEPFKADVEVRTKQPNEWTFKSSVNVFAMDKKDELSLRFVRMELKPKKNAK